MTAHILDGNALGQKLRAGFKQKADELAAQGVRPGLAVILVGEGYATLAACLASPVGKAGLFVFSAALVYHFLNGLRHLAWDAGHGYEIPKAYASGYAVFALTIVFTAVLWYVGLTAGGAA